MPEVARHENQDNDRDELISDGFINENGDVKVSKAKFARSLVEKEYVRASSSWRDIFRKMYYIKFREKTVLDCETINELTHRLVWEKCDGLYRHNGSILTAKSLSKAFCDGDPDYKKRSHVFLTLYHKNEV